MTKIAVTSRSFSQHAILRREICERYPHVQFNDSGKTLVGDALIQFLAEHDKAIIGLEVLNQTVLEQLPQLKVISRFGVGVDALDVKTMARLGMKLAVAAGANKRAVAELTIAFALTLLRQLPLCHQEVRSGIWLPRKGKQLSDCCVGIVGLGAVGKDVARLLQAFGCKLLAYDVIAHADFCHELAIEQLSLAELLQRADIVSLHIPLTEQTHNLLDAKHLAFLQPSALLINTARGGLVDESALKQMLQTERLAGAAFDVFATEPTPDRELLALPNFFATPHIGASTEEAIVAVGRAAIHGLEHANFPL